MYFGETHSAIDDKGRLAVPVQFRRIMEVMDHDTWFVTRGYDNALLLYPKERWDKLLKEELPGPAGYGLPPLLFGWCFQDQT